jgi:diguanylate cyclase (GGDEF)-like protein/PAS domain S-box-containing protein
VSANPLIVSGIDDNADAHLIEALRPAFEVLAVPACYVDRTERYRLANEQFAQWAGIPIPELFSRHTYDVVPPELYAFVKPYVERALAGEICRFERQQKGKDGQLHWVQVDYFPQRDPAGHVLGFMAMIHDIQRLKDMEQEASQRERRLKLITDNIGMPVGYIDRNYIFRFSNRPGLAGLGIEEHEMVGRHISDIFGADVFAEVKPYLDRALSGEKTVYERFSRKGMGHPAWIRTTLLPDLQPDGTVAGIYSVVADIDQDRRLRDALETKEKQLRLITNNIGAPITYIDAEMRFQFVNQPAVDWGGHPEAEVVGRHISEILGEAAFQYILPHLKRAFAGEHVTYERLAHWPRHGERWVRNHLFPDFRKDGSVAGIYTLLTDVTEDHRLRSELEAKERQLTLFTSNIPGSIAYLDSERRYRFVNNTFAALHGKTRDEVIGHTSREVIGDVVDIIEEHVQKVMRGEATEYVREVTLPSGEKQWRHVRLAPDFDEAGKVRGHYVVGHDISEERRLRHQIEEQEQRIRLFTENIPTVIAYLDTNIRYTFANDAFVALVGKTREEIIGRTPAEVVGHEASEHNRPYREQALAGKPVFYERLVTLPDGSKRWHRVKQAPDFGPDGKLRGIYVIGTDIHELKAAQAALEVSEAELRHALDSLPYPMAYVDRTLRYRYVNKMIERYSGKTKEELVDKDLVQVFDAERFAEIKPYWERALQGETVEVERIIRNVGGKDRWVLSRYTPRRDANGEVIGFYSCGIDIDELKLVEIELRHANSMLLSHFENTPLAVIEWDRDHNLMRWSPQAEKIFGWKFDELKRMGYDDWKLVYEDDEAQVREIYERLLSGEERRTTSLNRNYRKDGRVIWCEWYNSSLVDEEGKVLSILSLGQDVTARVLAEERLQHLATHDALTGLPNRVMLQERLRQAIARARRSGQRVCALFIDLDRFKEVNDTLGHRIGDELLREMSVRLGRIVRESDLLVRLSGDEFMVVLEQVTDLDAPPLVAQKLLDEIREPSHIEGNEIYVSASIGISLFPDDGDDAETLMRNADLAMYRAKEAGKNTWQTFSADMAAHGAETRLLENALRSAVARQEMELYYQPVLDMQTGAILGAEALLRWHHPTRGLLAPGEFIHLAEETGLVHDIGNWVLDSALAQLREWHANGHKELRVAINLSAGQFRAAHVAERIREKIRLSGCPADKIELEVTETSMLRDPEGVGHALAVLRDIGVRVAIDDFGTGYSSLSHLKRFPIDTLKVDRSFVTDVTTDAGDAAIVAAVIALGRTLDLDVIAEGVETEAQRTMLAQYGCNAYQGYLVSRPLPAQAFEAFLKSW